MSSLRSSASTSARKRAAREEFPLGSRSRARFERHITRPLGISSLCIVHLVVRDAARAAIILLSRKPRTFAASRVSALQELAPTTAVADTLHATLDGGPNARLPRRVRLSVLTPA